MNPDTKAAKEKIMLRLHHVVEWLDWHDVPPTRLWRWLLKRLDDRHEIRKCDYDY